MTTIVLAQRQISRYLNQLGTLCDSPLGGLSSEAEEIVGSLTMQFQDATLLSFTEIEAAINSSTGRAEAKQEALQLCQELFDSMGQSSSRNSAL